MVEIGGKQYEFNKPTLARMRDIGRLERVLNKSNQADIIENDADFQKLIDTWKAILKIILVDPGDLNPAEMDVAELTEAKEGFLAPAKRTTPKSDAGSKTSTASK